MIIKDKAECKKNMLPVRDALDILSGKWKLLRCHYLLPYRLAIDVFNEMQREIEGITAKMLSKELKELEINQLVKRTVYDTLPVTVEYTLTTNGKSLEKVIAELRTWGIQHRKKIIAHSLKQAV